MAVQVSKDVLLRISVTLALNGALAFAFRPSGRDYLPVDVAIDGAIFAVLTVTIDALVIHRILKKLWISTPPPKGPEPPLFVRLLPRSRAGMILILSLVFAPLCAAMGDAAFAVSGLATWTFRRYLVYKLCYAVLANECIARTMVRRWLMPDCFAARPAERVE